MNIKDFFNLFFEKKNLEIFKCDGKKVMLVGCIL